MDDERNRKVFQRLRQDVISARLKNDENDNSPKTNGQRLLDFLEASEDIDYVYYTAAIDEAEDCLTIRKKCKSKALPEAVDVDQFHKEQLSELVQSVTLRGGQEVLIAVAWVTKEQKRQVLCCFHILNYLVFSQPIAKYH